MAEVDHVARAMELLEVFGADADKGSIARSERIALAQVHALLAIQSVLVDVSHRLGSGAT